MIDLSHYNYVFPHWTWILLAAMRVLEVVLIWMVIFVRAKNGRNHFKTFFIFTFSLGLLISVSGSSLHERLRLTTLLFNGSIIGICSVAINERKAKRL